MSTAPTPPTLLHVFPTFVAAGAQMRVVRLVDGFTTSFRHRILALDGRTEATARITRADLDVGTVDPRAGVRGMARVLDEVRPDLLLTYNWGSFDAVIASRLRRGLPHVHHEDGFNRDEAERQKRRRVWARRLLLRNSNAVAVPSRTLERIARDVWCLPERVVRFVPNGIDVERFAHPPEGAVRAVRTELGIGPRDLVVGAVGHLRPVKCFGRLIEACARITPSALAGRALHLVVVGEGPERARLEAATREHAPPGGHVHLPGHRDDLAPWYSAFDVFALSSDSEQQPVSLLEAMAAGRPVAATDVGDVAAVAGEAAVPYIVPLEAGADGLSRALERLLEQDAERTKLGHALAARVREHYAFDTMLDAYRDLYEGCLR